MNEEDKRSRKWREERGREGALINWCIMLNEETGGEGERGRGYARLTQTKTNRRYGSVEYAIGQLITPAKAAHCTALHSTPLAARWNAISHCPPVSTRL